MFFLNQILRDSHGWVPCGSGADPKTERSLGHLVAGKKHLEVGTCWVARDKLQRWNLHLVCRNSRLKVGFLSHFGGLSQMHDWFAVSVFISIPNRGGPNWNQKPSQGTGESCRHQWHPLHAPGHGKTKSATQFKILPSFCEYGCSNRQSSHAMWKIVVDLWWIICPEKSVVWQVCWKEGSKNPFQPFFWFSDWIVYFLFALLFRTWDNLKNFLDSGSLGWNNRHLTKHSQTMQPIFCDEPGDKPPWMESYLRGNSQNGLKSSWFSVGEVFDFHWNWHGQPRCHWCRDYASWNTKCQFQESTLM